MNIKAKLLDELKIVNGPMGGDFVWAVQIHNTTYYYTADWEQELFRTIAKHAYNIRRTNFESFDKYEIEMQNCIKFIKEQKLKITKILELTEDKPTISDINSMKLNYEITERKSEYEDAPYLSITDKTTELIVRLKPVPHHMTGEGEQKYAYMVDEYDSTSPYAHIFHDVRTMPKELWLDYIEASLKELAMFIIKTLLTTNQENQLQN